MSKALHPQFPSVGVAYRVDAQRYAVADEHGEYRSSRTEIEIYVVQITRFTPEGFYFVDWADGIGWQERLVLDRWAKKHVNRTVEGALKDFISRRSKAKAFFESKARQAESDLRDAQQPSLLIKLKSQAFKITNSEV